MLSGGSQGKKLFGSSRQHVYVPPTFGRQISSLEQELGFPLFQRGWKKNQLTPAGTIMFEGFSKMTTEYNLLVSQAMEADAGLTGRLTLGLLEGQLVDTELRNVVRPSVPVFLRSIWSCSVFPFMTCWKLWKMLNWMQGLL
jgi:hypothetical protein